MSVCLRLPLGRPADPRQAARRNATDFGGRHEPHHAFSPGNFLPGPRHRGERVPFLSPLFALAVVAAALFGAALLSRIAGAEPVAHRYGALDGLRGLLAVFVFIHHAAIWYTFARTDAWNGPPSHLYNHLGQGSVAMFFMITGFLFFGKLLAAGRRPLDWPKLWASRLLRIVPLYLVAVTALLAVVAVLSGFELRVGLPTLLKDVLRWFSFALLGRPDLNGVAHTSSILAGVTWSLAYEWFFYFSLPLLAALLRRPVPLPWLCGSLLLLAFFTWGPFWTVAQGPAQYFLGGMVAAVVAQKTAFPAVATARRYGVLALTCTALAVTLFAGAYTPGAFVLLSVAFVVVACGNTLFGLLDLKPAKVLGELSYSIYLLHGLVLFVVLGLVLGPERVATFSALEYWLVVVGCVPALLALCLFTFRTVEAPAMRRVPWLSAQLRVGPQRSAPRGGRTGPQRQ